MPAGSPITDSATAITQIQTNLPLWRTSQAAAELLLEGIEWVLIHRPSTSQHSGSGMSFPSLERLRGEVEARVLGASNQRRVSFVRGRPR